MTTTDTLAERAAALTRDRLPFVRATVVRAQHPTSVHAGDTALVLPDGRIEGFVGGACSESSVRTHGLQVLETGEPLLLRIVPDAESTSVESGAITVANPCLSGGALEIFLEPRRPPPRIVVVGDTPVGRALATLAPPLGFDVAVSADDGVAPPDTDDAALVVASHGRGEEAALTAALQAGIPYVGLVASRTRGTAVLDALDVSPADLARVHSPAGLPLGARTAPEIALSILSEIVAERARRRPDVPAPPATAVDPVCGMTVAAVDASPHLEVDGERIWFCGEGCRRAHRAA